jgi:UDP-N-acetyl-D-mannosaminuronate dehydrogenase
MAKLAENAYEDVDIAFANELPLICQRLAPDV